MYVRIEDVLSMSHILFGCILHMQDKEVEGEVLMGGEVEGEAKVRRRGGHII